MNYELLLNVKLQDVVDAVSGSDLETTEANVTAVWERVGRKLVPTADFMVGKIIIEAIAEVKANPPSKLIIPKGGQTQ